MKSAAFFVSLFIVLTAGQAFASTMVWKDPVHGFTMSYPDSWQIQTDDTPNTRLRVAGPLAEDRATCRMKVIDDGRLKIYPKRLMDEAVVQKLDRDYWQGEAAQYEGAQVLDFYAPASLGDKGDATAIKVSFVDNDGQGKVPMYGVMIGSVYGDKRFVASCSSKAEVYARWSPVFMSVLDSVQLDARYHPFAIGYYRDFLADMKLTLPRTKPGTTEIESDSYISTSKYYR